MSVIYFKNFRIDLFRLVEIKLWRNDAWSLFTIFGMYFAINVLLIILFTMIRGSLRDLLVFIIRSYLYQKLNVKYIEYKLNKIEIITVVRNLRGTMSQVTNSQMKYKEKRKNIIAQTLFTVRLCERHNNIIYINVQRLSGRMKKARIMWWTVDVCLFWIENNIKLTLFVW